MAIAYKKPESKKPVAAKNADKPKQESKVFNRLKGAIKKKG